jgi:hypothetical protein
MTTIPPAPPPAATPTAPPPAVVTATPVSAVPAEIANLPPNATLDATVAATQARAVVALVTELGDLAVRLPLPVQPNAQLTLQLTGSGANLQFRVIAINGQALQPGPGLTPSLGELTLPPLAGPFVAPGQGGALATVANSPPQTGTLARSSAAAGEAFPSVPPNSGIAATVVFGTQPGLPTGTQLILRLLNIDAPVAGGPEFGTSPAGTPIGASTIPGLSAANSLAGSIGRSGAGIETAAGGISGLEADGSPAAPVGGSSSAPGLSAGPGTPSAATPTAGLPPAGALGANPLGPFDPSAPLRGVVAPNSLGGKPLIQTSAGLISLDAAPELQAGARVTFETVGNPIPPAATSSAAPAAAQANPAQPATGWSAFGDAMAVLQKADAAAAQMLVQRLPDLGPQFAVNAMGWIAAAQTDDIRAWLGDRAVKALEKAGRADLIERLEGDMGEMRASVTLPRGAGDWQVLTLPLFLGQQIERVRLTLRRAHDDEEAEGRDEEGLRFLLDVDMSRLGPLQLDGLVKRRGKRFDLIVRSRFALPDEVQREIGAIFARALDKMGMAGAAVFKQAVAFVEPLPAPAGRHAGLTI